MAKGELIDTGTHKRYVRRDERGRFIRSDTVGHQLSADRETTEMNASEKGQGDKRTARTATARSSWFGRLLLPVAGLVAITAGAVLTSATLRRGTPRSSTR